MITDAANRPAVPKPAKAQLWELGARELAAHIALGQVSAVEAAESHIARIEAVNPSLNAVVCQRYEEALAEAREADRHRAAGEPLGPLHGVPITVKECLDVRGTPSTFGAPSRRDLKATCDDQYVARLRRAGAIVLGKTNVAQLLAYYESDNPAYGRTNNPWDLLRTPGGSSGGQAAIVAAGGSSLGLGTDIGGSSRVPAAFCGVVGFKPTAGRLPDAGRGSFPIGQRAIVSQVGVFARSVADAALGLSLASGAEASPSDPMRGLPDFSSVDVSRLRVGTFVDDGLFTPSAAYRRAMPEAIAALRRRGAQVVELAAPDLRGAVEIFYRLLSADRFAGCARFLGKDPRDPRIKQIELAARAPAPLFALLQLGLRLSGRRKAADLLDYFGPYDVAGHWDWAERQLDYQTRWLSALDQAAGGPIDVVLSPATGLPALRHGASAEVGIIGAYSCLYNVLGWPAGIVPVTRVRKDEETATARSRDVLDKTAAASEHGSAGLPIAVQVAARPWHEHLALAAMAAIEAEARTQPDHPSLAALIQLGPRDRTA